ncbi:S41 family peptidase [Winogradskyella sp. A3E31]|uniref:S41 family peptidase n=1 Tax=Winogradskyella sp. A3E31 TaxID=3349637 RepID=UPI00398B1301
MKKLKLIALSVLAAVSATNCFEDRDDNLTFSTNSINDYVWKGMNAFYVYGDDVPNLTNERFGINGFDDRYDTTEEYENYLNGFSTPEALFESLIFQPGVVDRFSFIHPDLFELIDLLQGTSTTNGLRLFAYQVPGSDTEVFARISLVLNGSNADNAGLERNMVISGVDGTTLTLSNFQALLSQTTATYDFADYDDNGTETTDDDTITPNGQSVTLTREEFTDNPVHRTEILNIGTDRIGYIMYNSFRSNFEAELNTAFGQLAGNVDHLVLDLRYNGGGSITTAVALGSMVTGQFNGDVFSKAIYGPNRQDENTTFSFTNTLNGGASINSLNLDKLYVITTESSASASELIINSLRPYIDVVQIGETTTGKTTINRLVFDSPDFGSTQVTSAHTYVMFPLIGDSVNSNDELVPSTGLVPNITLSESSTNLGTLGDPNEPLLAAAIADITGTGRFLLSNQNENSAERLKFTTEFSTIEGLMFIE